MPLHNVPLTILTRTLAALSLFLLPTISASPPMDNGIYTLELEKAGSPSISLLNEKGKGFSPCNYTFNPAWIQPSPGTSNRSGLLLRAAQCPGDYGGSPDHIMFAYCEADGSCGDLERVVFPFEEEAQDPRVVFDEDSGIYTLWYYASGVGERTVYTRQSSRPFDPTSWESVSPPQPWHRNGCAFPKPDDGGYQYLIFGESPPIPAIGLARSADGFRSYETVNASFLAPRGPGDSREPEIVVEASTPVVQLDSGDFLHLYSAGTPGWVANGNYTAGFIVMNGSDPNQIIQRSDEHILIASLPFEGVEPTKGYPIQRYRTTFVTSIVPIPKTPEMERDTSVVGHFRLWWGAGDANVATGVLTVRQRSENI